MLTSLGALAGLITIPILAVIYLFHRRPRVRQVSSLMLWSLLKRPATGGTKREFLRLPLTFWLEAAALLLMVIALAGPMLPRVSHKRPLIVILDDSLSMQAGSHATSQQRAQDFLKSDVLDGQFDPVRFILAGETPQLSPLDQWSCAAPSANIDAALAFATQLAGPNALVMVVTDHAPPRPVGPRVRWRAFGQPERNAGFIVASRSRAGRDRVMLQIAGDADTELSLVANGKTIFRQKPPKESFTLDLPSGAGAIEARLSNDAAAFDNRIFLLPERRPPVAVSLDITNEALKRDVEQALNASGRALVTPAGSLLITDKPGHNGEWTLEIISGGKGVTHAGPFLLDRTHPLTAGADLDGVLWTASPGTLPGSPVILANNQPLLTDDAHHFRLRIDPSLSTLQRSPAWPSLIWNLLEMRSEASPGFRAANVVHGAVTELVLPPNVESARVSPPDSPSRTIAGPRGAHILPISASRPGLWSASAGNEHYQFACNALNAEESDLSHAATGTWNGWTESSLLGGGYEDVAWLFLLGTLGVLAMHMKVTA